MHTPHNDAPAAGYRERASAVKAAEGQLQREHMQLGYVRLAFAVAVVLLLLPPRPYVLLALAGFGLAARVHERILKQLAATRRALRFFQHASARVEEQWAGLRPRQPRVDASRSLNAADLDLFAPGGIFEMLCEARTSLGEDTLARWLLAPAPVTELQDRHAAIEDLRTRVPLREAFARAPGPLLATLDQEALACWGEAAGSELPQSVRWIASALVLLTLLAAWRSAVSHSWLPILVMLVVNGSLAFFLGRLHKPLFAELNTVSRSLSTIAALLHCIEREPFTAPKLLALQATLRCPTAPAHEAIGQLARLALWVEARGNYFVRLLDVPLLYSLYFGLAVQQWRRRYGAQLRPWLQSLGEFEALLSLAAYSLEHPENAFPQFTPDGPSFRAEGLGHPLLPSPTSVRNDVALGPATRLLLISGSNMSGKSTLLRAIGVNAVLAFAGAPVCAHSLQLSPLTVAASIQINDSLQAAKSKFYAEILRLRAITEAARTHSPVLFLLDELLAGTNSHDRLLGAQGLIRELLGAGAIGLVSTHDLALTAIGEPGHQAVRNAHFEDQILDNTLHFDYKLRDGAVERSNGLALMRMIGLEV